MFRVWLNGDYLKCAFCFQIDVTTVETIPAFCSSDEETEDDNVLQFLPIAPEVEDPEESAPPVINGKDSPPAKRPKYKSYEIQLEGPPCDGIFEDFVFKFNCFFFNNCVFTICLEPHPLLNPRSKDKPPTTGKKGSGKRISK